MASLKRLRAKMAAPPGWLLIVILGVAAPPLIALAFWYIRFWLILFNVWPGIEFTMPRSY